MANWHYINKDGEKITVTSKELKQLALQGTITPETIVETENGKTAPARKVTGLTFAGTIPSAETYSLASDSLVNRDIQKSTENDSRTNNNTVQPIVVPSSFPDSVNNSYCTNCGNPILKQAAACMSCGAKPTGHKKFCRHCGVSLKPEQIVCIKCGHAISTVENNHALDTERNLGQGFAGFKNMAGIDVTILIAAILALLSFFLQWIVAIVPLVGQVTRNGFTEGTFLLGLVFIYPTWMVLAGRRTNRSEMISMLCAGIGICFGIGYILSRIPDEEIAFGARTTDMIKVGIGGFVFVGACILLLVGVILPWRIFWDSRWLKEGKLPFKIGTDRTVQTKTAPPPIRFTTGCLLFIAILVFILFLCAILEPNSTKSAPKQRRQENREPFNISATGLMRAYIENSAVADEKFLDKTLKVNGYIKEINLRSATPYVALSVVNDMVTGYEITSILCVLSNKEGVALKNRGDYITLRGQCLGIKDGTVLLSNCFVEKDRSY